MRKSGVQRPALVALVFVIILIFVGAIVRTSGAGLGCPDWPTCWGEIIPPWKVEQVDFESLDVERFQKKAKVLGRNPDEITRESLRAEFNPVHTYIEFVNRLFALPVLLSSLVLMVKALRRPNLLKSVRRASVWSFILVIVNALLGAAVVFSGLKTGIITAHMIAAFILLFLLIYAYWAGGEEGNEPRHIPGASRFEVGVLLFFVVVEGILGSQLREMTDVLQREFGTGSRDSWIGKIEDSMAFWMHRSFSWAIFAAAVWVVWKTGWRGKVPRVVLVIVFAFMLMGIFFSYVKIHAVVQVLHVGLAAVLVSLSFYWWLAAGKGGSRA